MDLRSSRLALAAAAFLCACGAAAAQTAVQPTALDLAAAIRLAQQQPALRAAAHEVAASEAAATQAGSLPNPELAWLREGQQAGSRTTTVQLSQTIELGGKRQARVALARGETALAQAELAARRRELRADVIAAYYAVLVAADQQRLAGELAGLARQAVEVAAKRVAAGRISPIDETRARLAAVDAASAQAQAGAELAIARTRLGALVGMPPDSIAPAGQADALPEVRPLPAHGDEAGAVQRARSQLAAQEAQAGIERAARTPDLTLTLGSQREDGVKRRQAVLGLALPLPLFNSNQGRLTAALRRSDKARDELAAAQASTAAALAEAHTRYTLARDEAALLRREVLPQARSAWELTLRGFEAGKFALLDVLDAQRTWFQAQSRHAAALLAAWRAYADIERLAGADQPND